MAACYHPEARFSDPVFPALDGQGVCAMWAMLCESGKDLRVESSAIAADDAQGSAHWDAHYPFSGPGRPVLHRIDATFLFQHRLIVDHRDLFDFLLRETPPLDFPVPLLSGNT